MLQLDSGVVQSPPSSMDERSTCMLLGVAAFAKPCLKVRVVCVSTPAHLVRQGCALSPACKPRELSAKVNNLHLDMRAAYSKILTFTNSKQVFQPLLVCFAGAESQYRIARASCCFPSLATAAW